MSYHVFHSKQIRVKLLLDETKTRNPSQYTTDLLLDLYLKRKKKGQIMLSLLKAQRSERIHHPRT